MGLGFFEVINYSFYGEKEKEKLAITGKHLELENPLSQDLSLLRKTLLPYLLANFSKNIRKEDEVALFEVGKVFSVFSTGDSFEKLRIGGVWERDNRPKKAWMKPSQPFWAFLKIWEQALITKMAFWNLFAIKRIGSLMTQF